MKAEVVEIEALAHQRVRKLLPWAASGRLDATERKLVEEHLATCAACREEAAFDERLRAVTPSAGAAPDMDAALARLLPQLDEKAAPRQPRWMQWGLAAQFLLIAALGTMLARQPANQYHLLGAAATDSANIVVMFKPETSEEQLRSMIEASGAQVVGGPTATHAWLLHAERDRQASALALLRTQSAVTLAEPLTP